MLNDEHVSKLLADYGRTVLEHLESFLETCESPHLTDAIRYHLQSGGKRIRPALCLFTCEAFGGERAKAIPFAIAVELLHNMLLVHDDIEDGDRVRRDQDAVWVKYGLANGINIGDYMMACAYRAVLQCDVDATTIRDLIDIFTLTAEKTIQGQALDINSRANESFTVDDYLHIASLKTGYYLTFSMVGGARIAGASSQVAARFWDLGKKLGPAFQIRDDLIDMTTGKGRGGKVGADIMEGKPSVLYAYALESATQEDRARLIRIMRAPRDKTSDKDVEDAFGVFERSGAIEKAQALAERLVEEAMSTIDLVPEPFRKPMRDIAWYMARRVK